MLKRIPSTVKRIIHPASNAACGLVLSVLKPFNNGDFIEVGGRLGSVKSRGIKKTTLSSIDGKEIELNNTAFYTSSFHNLSSKNIVQLDVKLQVSYKSGMSDVKTVIMEALEREPLVLQIPQPKIKVSKLNAKHIELSVRPWCTLNDYEKLNQSIHKALISQLNLHDHLPYPNTKRITHFA